MPSNEEEEFLDVTWMEGSRRPRNIRVATEGLRDAALGGSFFLFVRPGPRDYTHSEISAGPFRRPSFFPPSLNGPWFLGWISVLLQRLTDRGTARAPGEPFIHSKTSEETRPGPATVTSELGPG